MSVGWESLPLLPLRYVLDHLSINDALNATAVCRHWRNALLIYEPRRELLPVLAKHTERNLFQARLFRKHVRRLHVYLDCTGPELDKFFNIVLPEYYNSAKLSELVFFGPNNTPPEIQPAKVKRIVTESLIFKNFHSLTKFGMIGCEMDVANERDRCMLEQLKYNSLPLSWPCSPSAADSVLSSSNIQHMMYSKIQLIAVDYDQVSIECLETLSHLPMFHQLAVTITNKLPVLHSVDWRRVARLYPKGLSVGVHILGLDFRRLHEVMTKVLVEGMTLVSLKVMFCKNLYIPLITHVVRHHKSTLRELAWIDAPHAYTRSHRIITSPQQPQIEACNINPFILLCWRCVNLRRLVIHGYWIWQYDVLGFVRLRKSLQHVEISCIYDKQRRYVGDGRVAPSSVIRAYIHDPPSRLDPAFIQEVRSLTSFTWSGESCARALRPRAERTRRAVREIIHTIDTM